MTTANSNEASGAATTGPNPASWQLDPSGSSVRIQHKTIWLVAGHQEPQA